MPVVEIEGVNVNVEGEIRDGTKVLFAIHGAGGGAWLWRRLRDALGDTVSLLAIDLPGHGASGGNGRSSVSDYRDIVSAAARELDVVKPIAMGHSMGGAIAMDWAINLPAELSGLVLISTGARLRVMDAVFQSIKTNYEGYAEGLAGMAFGENPPADAVDEARKRALEVKPEVTYNDFVACNNFDVMAELESISLPTLVLCGEKDIMTPPKYGQFLARDIAGAELRIFDGAGHMLTLERPAETAHSIKEWLGGV